MLFALACFYVVLGVVVMVYQAAVVKFDRTRLPKDMFPRSWTIALGFVVGVGLYHVVMIERTKAEIRRYILEGQPGETPCFMYHQMEWSWCGNAVSTERAWLYGDAAATGFDDPNPRIRARSLRATLLVSVRFGTDGKAAQMVIRHAQQDTVSEVQAVLEEFYGNEFWK